MGNDDGWSSERMQALGAGHAEIEANETSVAQEYEIRVGTDSGIEQHRVIGVLVRSADPDEERLAGERVYASERLIRLMAGDALFEELEPLGEDR